MTEERLEKQRKRLNDVSNQEWNEAYLALARRLLFRLGGYLTKGPHGETLLKGGKTRYYAHSEDELDENVLHHYAREFLFKLKDGDWEWPEDVSLSQQLENMADSTITHDRAKYARRKKKEEKERATKEADGKVVEGFESHIIEFIPSTSSFDERYMTGESPASSGGDPREDEEQRKDATERYHHGLWEKVCDAADGDPELEAFVQMTGESESMKDVNRSLGLTSRDRERIQKNLRRKLNKKN